MVSALIALIFFNYPSDLSFKLDDFTSQVFYATTGRHTDSSDLVVIEIDNETLRVINSKWPFNRAFYADFLNNLQKSEPKVLGFDIVFAGKSDDPEKDKIFAHALQDFEPPVILAYFIDREGSPSYPYAEFKKNADLAFVNVFSDRDRTVRNAKYYFESETISDFSWAAKIASYFYQTLPEKDEDKLPVAGKNIATQESFPINYLLKPKDFQSISFHQLIKGNFDPEIFAEKIVLVGSTLDITHDIHSTPLGVMPGVYIQANIILNFLNNRLINNLPFIFNFSILLLVFLLISYFLYKYSFLRSFFLSLGVLLLLFWLNIWLRSLGIQLAYGRIVFSSIIFISLANLYIYLVFLKLVSKVKNHAVTNPLTGLFNVRYFFESLFLNLKRIPKIPLYMIVIYLKDFSAKSSNLDFSEIKAFWRKLRQILLSYSKLWCNYSEEIILGEIKNKKGINALHGEIQILLSEFKINDQVKIGLIKASDKILQKSVILELTEKINTSEKNIIFLENKDILLSKPKKQGPSDFLSSFYFDTEEKNRELVSSMKKLKKEEEKTKNAYLQLIYSLVAALESKDPYTQGHTNRVCKYSLLLADKINLSSAEKEKIRKAALLHDLGKIGISDFVLHKRGKLTDSEFEKIKEHQTISARILKPIDEFKEIIPYILYHHENFDGTGYPHGLAGNFIPLGARIIAIADVFDALITGRDYKKAFSPQKAVALLKEMKSKRLDPKLVDIFIEAIGESGILD